MRDYWEKKREASYKELSADEFRLEFIKWLQAVGGVPLKKVIDYYDAEFAIISVIDKQNNVLTLL